MSKKRKRKPQRETAAEQLLRLAAEARMELHAAHVQYRAVREAMDAPLSQEEKDYRQLYPPHQWDLPYAARVWRYGLPFAE